MGLSPAHHGELLQGAFADESGMIRRALVTLPHHALGSRARFCPVPGQGVITARASSPKARAAADMAMHVFATPTSRPVGGWIDVVSNIPRSIGLGSSTADVTAAIKAVADYHGASPPPEQVARLAVRAELASDSTMFVDRVVLFEQRRGSALEDFGPSLPAMIVIGCIADQVRDGIDTVALPLPEYDRGDIDQFDLMRHQLREAIAAGDVGRLAEVSTASARLNQRFVPKRGLETVLAIQADSRAAGVQVAHSGTVAGIIIDPHRGDPQQAVRKCVASLREAGLPITSVIDTRNGIAAKPY